MPSVTRIVLNAIRAEWPLSRYSVITRRTLCRRVLANSSVGLAPHLLRSAFELAQATRIWVCGSKIWIPAGSTPKVSISPADMRLIGGKVATIFWSPA